MIPSSKSSWLRSVAYATFGALVVISGIGYGLAWAARAQCADALYEELRARQVSGTTLGGDRVLPARDDAHAEVTAPFEVNVRITVPRGLHATIYTKRFLVWPWGLRARATKVDALV